MKERIAFVFLIVLFLMQLPLWEEDAWSLSLKKMSSILPLVENHYYREIDHTELAFSSIRGLINTLDPHSYFLDPNNLATMREDYRGKYYGLGIIIQKHGDRLVVIAPLEGTPAYRLGIQPGDVISHIEGESTKPISSFQALQKLRGRNGTKITITIVREGLDEPMDLTITREEIPLNSVSYAFMLTDDVGYIYIRNFSESTGREFREKIKNLESQGMKKLVLDFRTNGGGTFFQSLEISDEFLPKGSRIVSIKGRKTYYNKDFFAEHDNQHEDIPLIVLINRGTASAPEIVSGAVKDNDRGLIIGESSWGKGLVQTVFPLSSNAAVALTTAKYYTPSGRSIQRDYTHIEDYRVGVETPEEEREVAYTAKGRKVLGQGGISPDYVIRYRLKPLTYILLLKGAFFSYAKKFVGGETPLSQKVLNEQPLDQSFRANGDVLEDFKVYIKGLRIEFEPKDFEEARHQIKREIDRQIFSLSWGIEEGERIFRLSDPVVKKAIETFPEAESLIAQN